MSLNASNIVQIWDRVRTSLWFIPGLMAIGAFALASVAPVLDRLLPDNWDDAVPLIFSGSPDGARAMLTTIASSVITVAGVVFSMTIVSLQLASSQFGPRLLRTFLRDTGNQIVFGVLLGTFLFCLIVMPTVDAGGDSPFVPRIAVTMAVVLALVCLASIVYFVDHVAQSIHADAVIGSVDSELCGVIDNLFPDQIGEGEQPRGDESRAFEQAQRGDPIEIRIRADGFLRFINGQTLIEIAARHDGVVHGLVSPGQYLMQGDIVARAWFAKAPDPDAVLAIHKAYVLGMHRTTLQDVLFAFEQLTEMALRALSPGINDPTTAVHCLDRIGSGLAQLVRRELPSTVRLDEDGEPRLMQERVPFSYTLERAVEPISRHADNNLIVWLRLLEVLGAVAERAQRDEDGQAIRALSRRINAKAHSLFDDSADTGRLDEAAAWLGS